MRQWVQNIKLKFLCKVGASAAALETRWSALRLLLPALLDIKANAHNSSNKKL